MLVIEFISGPGAGKSTIATSLFAKLKRKSSVNIDFAREGAQQLIHIGCAHKLNNTLLVVAHEYERLCNMRDQGCEVLITDTSLLLNRIYGKEHAYYKQLSEIVDIIRQEFEFKTVFVNRVKPFVQYGRVHTEEQSVDIDQQIKTLCGPFDATINGDDEGIKELYKIAKGWIENDIKNLQSNPI